MRGKVAVVTGAAGGIGGAVVRSLGARGVRVAAVDLHSAEPDSAPGAPEVLPFACDVADADAVENMVEATENRLGPIDFLVNAAGVLRLGTARQLTDTDWSTTFAVNATGVFNTSRAVVNRMAPRGSGALVTIVSNAAATPRVQMSAYAASKAAAEMFTKCLGLEVAEYGIRCNLVAPGSTDTPMLTSMWADETGRIGTIDGVPGAYRVGIPLRKLAAPEDIADAALFLLSDRAAHITMHRLTVDGGATLGV
ncbi:2,3-dihydro-2,3-dihydroxybenzoate dehydrogenase [Nocardia huaxiensis]|uniref:2,3-dihydro-2,3-dihydroxybenzoate dehydrogenase n=1 Tax=Nocardia huaxiensis TaxID=2755382 RepID=UPI001E2F8B79|nr:2,3-dihydro-2,3-dihydroxybenzoate dehydrogenase [Nocardia huaxiensis]UFS99512.1 2,3-dihydro-2,3-dihydroxybenzoate dehydrogenase [Nocardia huaxiensis]